MKRMFAAASAFFLLLIPAVCEAQTATSGYVKNLEHWSGHAGILVKLDGGMIDPQNCGRVDWFIMPDNSPRAQFVQALLLTAQASQRPVQIFLSGCLDGMPQILAVSN